MIATISHKTVSCYFQSPHCLMFSRQRVFGCVNTMTEDCVLDQALHGILELTWSQCDRDKLHGCWTTCWGQFNGNVAEWVWPFCCSAIHSGNWLAQRAGGRDVQPQPSGPKAWHWSTESSLKTCNQLGVTGGDGLFRIPLVPNFH